MSIDHTGKNSGRIRQRRFRPCQPFSQSQGRFTPAYGYTNTLAKPLPTLKLTRHTGMATALPAAPGTDQPGEQQCGRHSAGANIAQVAHGKATGKRDSRSIWLWP